MTGLEIAALMAMLGGAYVQNRASSDAADRAKREALANAQRQDQFSQQAEKKALSRAQEYSTDTRQAEQSAIEQDLTQGYMAPVESAQAINAAATTTQGEVSNDYKAAKAQSDLAVAKNARQLAGLMAKVNSANRLRGNEAIRMTDTGMDIDRLGNFANREGQIGQFAVQQAGRPDSGQMAIGSLMQGAGTIGLAGGFDGLFAGAGEAGSAATVGDWMGKTGAGIGTKGTAAVGTNLGQPLATGSTVGFKVPNKFSWSNFGA